MLLGAIVIIALLPWKITTEPRVRTRLCDPAFANDTASIDEIATKHYGHIISVNVTDVRKTAVSTISTTDLHARVAGSSHDDTRFDNDVSNL